MGRAGALEVQKTLWGFDGHVVPGYFSPLSLLVSNPGDRPFDGDLTCTEMAGLAGQRGAEYLQPVYLAPHTARWVQFQIFFQNAQSEIEVSWGRGGGERLKNEAGVVTGPPACVWLYDESNPFAQIGGFKFFPDALFPTTAAATDGLDAVVLDYAPRWEPARRDAFLDWIKSGGTVHLLRGADGKFPVFSESLAPLNISGARSRIGSGMVVRHDVASREMTPPYLAQHGFLPRTLKQDQNTSVYDLENALFQKLSRLTRPDIGWGLISVISLVYLALMGPTHYFWRRKLDYRLSILAFLGSVAVFGGMFAVVGRRGYNESQTVHSLAIARSLGGGRCDVTQWISAFATSGDVYMLSHTASANIYAAPSSEAVRGRVLNGKDGQFVADIPLYSSVAFTHRAVMEGDDTSVMVEKWEVTGSAVSALRLKPGPRFPKDVIEMRFRYGDTIRQLVRKGNAFEFDASDLTPAKTANLKVTTRVETLKDFLSADKLRNASQVNWYGNYPENAGEPQKLEDALPLLYARALGLLGSSAQILSERPMPADMLQLFVAAQSPDGFRLKGKGFDRETGCVLYIQDVYKR